jgi:hypothetical protein
MYNNSIEVCAVYSHYWYLGALRQHAYILPLVYRNMRVDCQVPAWQSFFNFRLCFLK